VDKNERAVRRRFRRVALMPFVLCLPVDVRRRLAWPG
jgi:hypothetical protein